MLYFYYKIGQEETLKMKFEWDEDKNFVNKEKHKISFETAVYVLMILITLKCLILNTVLMRIGILRLERLERYCL